MLDRSEYYHGAAIARLLEDERCQAVRKKGALGYIVNDSIFVFLKYTTKTRSPWNFTFDQEDIERCQKMLADFPRVVLGLVCGGDGVCALEWSEAETLLSNKAGRISAGRKHNESYAVWGTAGEMKRKVQVGRWPSLLFSQVSSETSLNIQIYA